MTNSKKIEYASVDLTTTHAAVVDGQVKFRENTANHILKNFFVPDTIETEKQLSDHLSQLLYKSDCDIASVRSVYVQEWNAV